MKKWKWACCLGHFLACRMKFWSFLAWEWIVQEGCGWRQNQNRFYQGRNCQQPSAGLSRLSLGHCGSNWRNTTAAGFLQWVLPSCASNARVWDSDTFPTAGSSASGQIVWFRQQWWDIYSRLEALPICALALNLEWWRLAKWIWIASTGQFFVNILTKRSQVRGVCWTKCSLQFAFQHCSCW